LGGVGTAGASRDGLHDITRAVVHGASRVVRELKAKLVVVASHSGATALALSGCRNFAPTVGVSDREETLRQMALYWGVMPLPGAPATDAQGLLQHVIAWGKAERLLSAGDRIVFLSGTQPGKALHNVLVVVEA
ncbi:MAG: pyruvate kinase, partial [Planctomycetia bacterium]|nr:pyruvate kinase [Planctomycetia bacterium]